MSALDLWEGPRARPEDDTSSCDHDALMFADVAYMILLRRARTSFRAMLKKMSNSPGFSGDINGAFTWQAPGWDL